jgi:tetratricopeptide (TPR) repeat protein
VGRLVGTDIARRTHVRVTDAHLAQHLREHPIQILARVDALDERSRRVMQVASVLGHAFPSELLRRVLGPGDWSVPIEHLASTGLLERRTHPRADGAGAAWTWHLRHPLVQETVYASLLGGSRTALHRAAGEAIESMTNAQVPDRAALLALHFARSDDEQRAVTYLCMAGDRARSLFLNREAIQYYDGALARLDRAAGNDPQRRSVLVARAETQAVLAEDEAALDSLLQAIGTRQRPEERAELWVRCAEIHRRRGEFGLAEQELGRAEQALGPRAEAVHRARVQIGRAMLAFDSGTFEEARRLGHTALSLLAGKHAPQDEAAAWRAIGISAASSGDLPVAVEALRHARHAAHQAGDAMLVAAITSNIGVVFDMQGCYQEARDAYRDSLGFYERVGAKRQIASLWINLGALVWMHGEGDWQTAQRYWLRAASLCQEIGDRRNMAEALANLAEGLIVRGELAAARLHVERALDLARALGRQHLIAHLERLAAA